jgi:ankyrin repeat protein
MGDAINNALARSPGKSKNLTTIVSSGFHEIRKKKPCHTSQDVCNPTNLPQRKLIKEHRQPGTFALLPNEIKFMVATHLDVPGLNALARTTKGLRHLLTHSLYRYALNQSILYGGPYFASAVSAGNLLAVRIFIEHGASLTELDATGWAALHYCAADGQEAVAQFLIDRGADIQGVTGTGRSPLVVAIDNGQHAMVKFLLGAGAGILTTDEYGWMPLHSATRHGNEAIIQCLLEAGADPSVADRRGYTPLHNIVAHDNEAAARLLIDAGASILQTDQLGRTALHWAAWYSNKAVVEFLIGEGADTSVTDIRGATPLGLARDPTTRLFLVCVAVSQMWAGRGVFPP